MDLALAPLRDRAADKAELLVLRHQGGRPIGWDSAIPSSVSLRDSLMEPFRMVCPIQNGGGGQLGSQTVPDS